MRPSKAIFFVVLCLAAAGAAAQQVKVFDPEPAALGSTPTDWVTQTDLNQPILFIPVVTQDTAWDPVNNLLPVATLANLQQRAAQVSAFWFENSYGRISFQAQVRDRVYQMPRGKSFYFNPSYVEPVLTGTQIKGPSVAVPAGTLRLSMHISDADQATINIPFIAADSPYTLAALKDKICNNLGAGDKLVCDLVNDGLNLRHVRIAVGQPYVTAGTFIHVDTAGSSAAILDALGLGRPVEDVTAPGLGLDTRGAEFPFITSAATPLTLTLTNQAGATEDFVWNVPAQTFNNANDVVAAIGAANPNGSITVAGGELHFTVNPTALAGPFTALEANAPADLLDSLGLSKSREADGVIDFPSRNTIRGNRNLLAGQAVAALLLNELTRPPGPGPDEFPNQAITAANEAAINTLVANIIDPNRAVIVVFLDPPLNQRAGAAGGYINLGIENGGYTYQYQMFANVQIIFDTTSDATIAHELGHNVGFYDLYNNSNDYLAPYRYPGNWDVMNTQDLFPHTDIWHKEIIAHWLTAAGATIDTFPDPAMPGAQTRHYAVTPLEFGPAEYDGLLAGVPAGTTKVKGIRLPLGLGPVSEHHYLTITNRQAGTTFSQMLPQKAGAPAAGGLYIADSISPASWSDNLFNPSTRNVVHPLTDIPPLVSGDVSPVLDNAPNPDIDILNTFPAYDGLTVNVVGQLNGPGTLNNRRTLLVDVTRDQKDFLDLAITPWGAPPYESPDIWIEHADGSLSATPLPGNGEPARWSATYDPAANGGNPLNWIRVNVSNVGTVGATNVRVRVKVNQPGGMGDTGTWVALPTSDPQDIPAGQSRIFNLGWTPRVNNHTCVQAEVISWDSVLGDRDPWNQRTQENVNDFYPTSSSPWGPTPMEFDISNNRRTPIDVYVAPQNLPPGYIVQLDQTFLTIPAKSKVRVTGTLSLDSNIIPPPSQDRRPPKPGLFHIAAFLMNGEYQLPMGGITYRVFPNKKINADVTVTVDGNGNVVVDGTTNPVAPGDHVEILVCYASGRCEWVETTTDGSGHIHVVIPPKEPGHVNVSVYLPPNYGPSRTVDTTVDPANPGFGPPAGGGSGWHEFGFFVGGFFPAHKTQLESGLDTGFRFGRTIAPHWSLEGEGGIVFTRRLGQRGLLGHAQAHALWHAGSATQPVRPFLLIGAGFASFQAPASSDTAAALVWGVGADFRWRPDVGFRFDIRDFMMNDLFGSGTTNNFQALWGVTFRF